MHPSATPKLRIAIVTTGRFHVLDLARELASLGYDVAFYSYVPKRRAKAFGLPARCHRSLLPFVLPFVFLQRKTGGAIQRKAERLIRRLIDCAAAWRLEPCDVFIGMSGLCVQSAQIAREKFGAKIYLERGSRHILSQQKILSAISSDDHRPVSQSDVEDELWGYAFADVITIPSQHVEESFLERGYPAAKLFRNAYGVDLEMFPSTSKPQNPRPTLLFAGAWCLRKGCDVLTEAIAGQPWQLIHVGSQGDLPFPNLPNFRSLGFVQQSRLGAVYARSDVFVHPSREEGLSLVQAQALASGLPLVCTDRTGGADLRAIMMDPSLITVVPSGDANALRQGIQDAIERAEQQTGQRDILGDHREVFSWRSYGERYAAELARGREKPCVP